MRDNIVPICSRCGPKPGAYVGVNSQEFIGKDVKIAFPGTDRITGGRIIEHMWVSVREVVQGTTLSGKLANDPETLTDGGFSLGSTVALDVKDIEDVYLPEASLTH